MAWIARSSRAMTAVSVGYGAAAVRRAADSFVSNLGSIALRCTTATDSTTTAPN
jgi:hypothetical protein